MNTDRPKKFVFSKNNDLSFVQDFINTKLHNPHIIEQLKLNQLKRLELQKAKLNHQTLLTQLQKNNKHLLKTKKIYLDLKQTSFTKDQEIFNIQEKINRMSQNISQLLIIAKNSEIHPNSQKNIKLKQLEQLSRKQSKSIEDENSLFQALFEIKKEKLSTIVTKKLKLFESLQGLKNEAKLKHAKKQSLKACQSQKSIRVKVLEQFKTTLTQKIKFLMIQKHQTLANYQAIKLLNARQEEECILKLGKFVKDLNQIVKDPKGELEQKKNMISVLMNVHCPKDMSQVRFRSISVQLEGHKQKHESLQTRISLENASQSSANSMILQTDSNQTLIPSTLMQSLKQKGVSFGLKQFFNDSRFQQPIIRRTTLIQQSETKKNIPKLIKRDSLPTSLNEKDIQNQFLEYCGKQLSDLQSLEEILLEKQEKLENEIRILKRKCQQKDQEIFSIKEQSKIGRIKHQKLLK